MVSLFKSIFQSKKSSEFYSLSKIGVDIHSHLIPGIDDGSQSMDDTIGMLYKFKELGYSKVITTPHVMTDQYRNSPEIIKEGLKKVQMAIAEINLEIEIEAAAEYFFDEFLIEKVKRKEILTFGDNYVLVEFSFLQEPMLHKELFFAMKTNGYQPVLAHFERYPYYFKRLEEHMNEYKSMGVCIQMNLLSLTGHYGPGVRKQAESMVDNKFIDFVGSDCHRIEHLQILEKNLQNKYYHKLSELELLNSKL